MDLYTVLLKRRSVRNFSDRPIDIDIVNKLIEAANNCPSGGNIQPFSILLVQEKNNRAQLAEIVGNQPWVRNAPLSMIFCLDFHRIKRWAALNHTEFRGEQAITHFLIGYADVMCAAQTVVILAESLGLGSVYIGTILSNLTRARQVFGMPDHVLPMMVLTLGFPRSIPRSIPKLEPRVITHFERYRDDGDAEVERAFQAKYGPPPSITQAYLEKAFIESVEADKQGGGGWMEYTLQEMKRLEIKNDAEFLFKVRYPPEVMVAMNVEILEAIKTAGFDLFGSENPG